MLMKLFFHGCDLYLKYLLGRGNSKRGTNLSRAELGRKRGIVLRIYRGVIKMAVSVVY